MTQVDFEGPDQHLSDTAYQAGPDPSLVHLLQRRASDLAARSAYTFLADEDEVRTLDCRELDRRARSIAGLLQQYEISGERVLLLFPPGLDFVAAFFGCLYSGGIAVPTQLPPSNTRRNHGFLRFQAVADDARPSAVLTTRQVLAGSERLSGEIESLKSARWIEIESASEGYEALWRQPVVSQETLAFLQYTSGSTATPKGVMVTHGNLLYNSAYINDGFQHSPDSVGLTWLPHFHDMGLIDGIIQPLYKGFPCYLMSPLTFLQSPVQWLKAIGRFRVTHTGGPNFAYELCTRKVSSEQKETLDLSSWSVAYNGAEPVRAETLEAFAAAFQGCGFRKEAFYPAYGMAEATLKVTGGRRGRGAVFCQVDGSALERDRIIDETGDGSRRLVGSGRSSLGTKVVVVDPNSLTVCAADRVGEIWVSGPGVARGYWRNREETLGSFEAYLSDSGEGPFLRTGDLGFLKDGELFVTGRKKELIIIRGLNHYPQDIERTVQTSHPALRPGGGAVFSVESLQGERLVVVQEVDARKIEESSSVVEGIRRAVAEGHEIQPYAVVLVKPGAVPKTTSGKIQRRATRDLYESGELEIVAEWVHVGEGEALPELPSGSLTHEATVHWLKSLLAARLGVESSVLEEGVPIVRYGLDSLGAIEIANVVRKALSRSLTLSDILGGSSLEELAVKIVNRSEEPSQSITPVVASAKCDVAQPLTPGQHSLWLLQQINPESAAYNIAAAVRVISDLNVDALHRSFRKLIDRHASLRSSIVVVDGSPFQTLAGDREVDFNIEDVQSEEAPIDRRIAFEANRPFDLESDALLRVRIYKAESGQNVLLLVVHHIVADLWSMTIILRELGEIYTSELNGTEGRLAPCTLQYSDYVQWQRQMLETDGERLWSYWHDQLAGAQYVLSLQTDRPRPTSPGHAGDRINFTVAREGAEGFAEICRRAGVTLYAGLLSVFMVLMSRYSGQTDILIGSPAAGRSIPELAGLVGYLVNPLVIRGRLDDEIRATALLRQIGQTALAAFEHESYPFPLLVQRLHPEWDPSRSPIFQILFAFQSTVASAPDGIGPFALGIEGARTRVGEMVLESVQVERRASQFDLSLAMCEAGDSLAGSVEYDTELFDAATISRIIENLKTLLGWFVRQPESPVITLPIVSDCEVDELLREWNDTGIEYPRCSNLAQLFERQASETPDRIALCYESEQLSYGELASRTLEVAEMLAERGAGPDVIVGVLMQRSIEMVVALLGVLTSGAAYLPLDPADPEERLSLIADESGLGILLTNCERVGLTTQTEITLISVSEHSRRAGAETGNHQSSRTSEDNLAYVIYTSGSTGRPKGAMNTHRGIINRLLWMQQEYGLTESDTVLQKTPYTFDVSVWEFFWPLITGARLVICRPDAHKDAAYLSDIIIRQRVTTLHFVPSMLAVFLDDPAAKMCGSIRRVICSGEELGLDLEQKCLEQLDAELHNLYGPTEAAVDVTYWRCDRSTDRARVPVGKPIANTRIHIVDRFDQLLPAGAAGQLLIGGAGLGRGYLNRSDLTAEKFGPNPFDTRGNARVYRSGDLARYTSMGAVEFLGRMDYQVKIRGFRIELGEIEAALRNHPGISEAVVVARQGAAGPTLVAYFVPEAHQQKSGEGDPDATNDAGSPEGRSLSLGSLRRYVSARLPGYMVPAAFVMLKQLPLTPSGKINRLALPAPDSSRPQTDQLYRFPLTELDKSLAEIFGEVLSVDKIGIDDNFFELGGHSLLAAKVLSRIRETLRVEVPFRSLFENPTVAGLGQVIAGGQALSAEAGAITRICPPAEELLLSKLDKMSEDEIDRLLLKVTGDQAGRREPR